MNWTYDELNKPKDRPTCQCTNKRCGRKFRGKEVRTFKRDRNECELICPICKKGYIKILNASVNH